MANTKFCVCENKARRSGEDRRRDVIAGLSNMHALPSSEHEEREGSKTIELVEGKLLIQIF